MSNCILVDSVASFEVENETRVSAINNNAICRIDDASTFGMVDVEEEFSGAHIFAKVMFTGCQVSQECSNIDSGETRTQRGREQ